MEEIKIYQIPENIEGKATTEQLLYIIRRAEKRFTETKQSDSNVITRTNTLIGFIVTILIGLSGYVFTQIIKSEPFDCHAVITVGFSIIYVYLIFFYVIGNIKSVSSFTEGTPPKNLMTDSIVGKEKDIKYMYEIEIESLQKAIDANVEINNAKWNKYDYALYAIALLPVLATLIYILTCFL